MRTKPAKYINITTKLLANVTLKAYWLIIVKNQYSSLLIKHTLGLKDLRGFFEEAFKLFDTDSIEGAKMKEVVIKDIVYTIWKVKTPK